MNHLVRKWQKILDYDGLPPIKDYYKKAATAVLLENQERDNQQQLAILKEDAPANVTADIARFDPILIKLVRRMAPNNIAHDVCGFQPLNQPVGLIFALRARYGSDNSMSDNAEALFNEAVTTWSGATSPVHPTDVLAGTGTGMSTAVGEGVVPNKMGMTIEKITVEAKTRALSAEYSVEMAQDLKSLHNLDAETELVNILSQQILAEQNREIVRTIYYIAEAGAQVGTTTAGVFDLDTDSDGRWSVERFKGLLYQAEREANAIAKRTRMGKGNIIICSSDVASALAMAGQLDYAPAMSTDLEVDDTGNTFAGVLNKRIKVYIDPYFYSPSVEDVMVVGFKGSVPYNAGLFFCPYVPLTMYRTVDPNTFQPKIAFKTRYGLVSNPFNNTNGALTQGSNRYYRLVKIKNIL